MASINSHRCSCLTKTLLKLFVSRDLGFNFSIDFLHKYVLTFSSENIDMGNNCAYTGIGSSEEYYHIEWRF